MGRHMKLDNCSEHHSHISLSLCFMKYLDIIFNLLFFLQHFVIKVKNT